MSKAVETPFVVVPRPSEEVSVRMPSDAVRQLEEVAEDKDMSVQALLRFYIGQGLRQDIMRRFSEQVITKTEEVLLRHLESEERVDAIMREVRSEFTPRTLSSTK